MSINNEFIRAFRVDAHEDNKFVIPICGSALSRYVNNDNFQILDWESLIYHLINEIGFPENKQFKIKIALKNEDYLTAISLVRKQSDTARFNSCFHSYFQTSGVIDVSQADLPTHMGLWCTGIPIVITTSFDDLLERSRPIAESCSLQNSSVEMIVQKLSDSSESRSINPTIFHVHGKVNIDNPSENSCLITWKDYLYHYQIDKSLKDKIISILTENLDKKLLTQEEREIYIKVLDELLEECWLPSSTETEFNNEPKLKSPIYYLITHHTLLFLGFSNDDPFQRVILPLIISQHEEERNWQHYYISPDSYIEALPGFQSIFENERESNEHLYLTLTKIAHSIYEGSIRGSENEFSNREEKYLSLREKYSNMSWIFQDKDSLVPFVELWGNRSTKPISLGVEVTGGLNWNPSLEMVKLRETYWEYRGRQQRGRLVNEVKVRVNTFRETEAGICLNVEPVEYKDYLISNHMVANMNERELDKIGRNDQSLRQELIEFFGENSNFSPRDVLCGNKESISLTPNSSCSNHLGVSALLIGRYEISQDKRLPVILCPPSTNQVSSPNDIIPSVSGSIDWPIRLSAADRSVICSLEEIKANPSLLDIDKELRREFVEECRWDVLRRLEYAPSGSQRKSILEVADEEFDRLLSNQVVINLCQNIERGGKPEIFYLLTLKEIISMNIFLEEYFHPNWELEKLWLPILEEGETDYLCGPPGLLRIFLIPSPIDVNLQISPDYKVAFKVINSILNNPGYNPVLRAHLASLLLFCKRIFPNISEEIATTLAPDLIHSGLQPQ